MNARRATVLDLPDLLAIARDSYGLDFDELKAREFGLMALMNPNIGCFRTEDAFCIGGLSEFFWEDERRANVMFLAVRDKQSWQAVKALRAVVAWAKAKGAGSFHFGEETGMRMDVIAKRIGASKDRPSYRIDLRSPQHRFWRRAA